MLGGMTKPSAKTVTELIRKYLPSIVDDPVEVQLDDDGRSSAFARALQREVERATEELKARLSKPSIFGVQLDDARTAIATKVWKVECPCGTNWVYAELDASLPDECENCGRDVEIRESWQLDDDA